jgi:hypothetical protein
LGCVGLFNWHIPETKQYLGNVANDIATLIIKNNESGKGNEGNKRYSPCVPYMDKCVHF